jgi:hypothetical protein
MKALTPCPIPILLPAFVLKKLASIKSWFFLRSFLKSGKRWMQECGWPRNNRACKATGQKMSLLGALGKVSMVGRARRLCHD